MLFTSSLCRVSADSLLRRWRGRAGFLAALLAVALVGGQAQAQVGTLDTYVPGPTPEDDFQLARPADLGHMRLGAMLQVDYALNPLVWEDTLGDASTERLSVVEHELVGWVVLSLGLADRVVLFGGLPTVLVMSGASDADVAALGGPAPADGTGVADPYLGGRIRIVGAPEDSFALGFQTALSIPASSGEYRGDAGLTASPMLLAEVRVGGGSRLVFNAGGLIRKQSLQSASNLEFSNELRLGAGIGIPVWKGEDPRAHLDLLAQVNGGTTFRDFLGRESSHAELPIGLKLTQASGFTIGAEAGPGIVRGIGTPDLRAVLMIGWNTPVERAEEHPCKDTPEDRDGFEDNDGCDDPDNDKDGFLDKDDECPNEPENVNEWEDTDGCPDAIPDTDGDGLLDPDDKCPNEPEDKDAFEDEDGCPDPDNDKDGVLDVDDSCPLEPGPADNKGCPDKDRDVDTLVDRRDNCPDVPGPVDNMGCPKEQKQQVKIEKEKIEILDAVYFRTDSDKILEKSFGLLDNVVEVLKTHPEIKKVRVEGHTDSRGKREHNLDLSGRRAKSVMKYLTDKGVEADRLESAGFGPDQPVVPDAKTKDDHAKNRRVLFKILGDTEGVSTTTTGPTEDTIDR